MGYFRCSKGESLWDIGIEQRAAAEKTEEKTRRASKTNAEMSYSFALAA